MTQSSHRTRYELPGFRRASGTQQADGLDNKNKAPVLSQATRSGVSAKTLQRTLGVTYKTAWRMFHQIRSMMGDDGKPLKGEVEDDEMYMHPNPLKRSSAKAHNSQVVFGMVERGGKAKVVHVKSSGKRVLVPEIQKGVKAGSTVYSDDYKSYIKLPMYGYPHASINHTANRYVDGNVHTQNIENVWSNMKRGIKGVYRHVDNSYLQAYPDEHTFRYSYRESQSMFWTLMCRVAKP